MSGIGKLMGIDHGLKRLGVAISDAQGVAARELGIIWRTSKREDFAKLNRIAQQEQVVAFVVGIPFSLDAPEGTYTQADKVRTWIQRLREATTLPVIEWDEQFSSDDARELAIMKRRSPDEPIDDLAARVMLQTYLDDLHDGLATFPLRAMDLDDNQGETQDEELDHEHEE